MPQLRTFAFHHESRAALPTSVQAAFQYLDDFHQLAAHMERPSAMMLGSRMSILTDEAKGRAVQSRVTMSGKVMGIPLSLEEIVVEREPPLRKAWEIVDARLIVIGDYRLSFELLPRGAACELRVRIDYDYPRGRLGRIAASLLGKAYARWCVEQMIRDAVRLFTAAAVANS